MKVFLKNTFNQEKDGRDIKLKAVPYLIDNTPTISRTIYPHLGEANYEEEFELEHLRGHLVVTMENLPDHYDHGSFCINVKSPLKITETVDSVQDNWELKISVIIDPDGNTSLKNNGNNKWELIFCEPNARAAAANSGNVTIGDDHQGIFKKIFLFLKKCFRKFFHLN